MTAKYDPFTTFPKHMKSLVEFSTTSTGCSSRSWFE